MTITNYQSYPQFSSSDGGGGSPSGLVLIDSGVEDALFFDIDIPSTGYIDGSFRVSIWELGFSSDDWLAAAFSFDGGVTFLNAHNSYHNFGLIGGLALDGAVQYDYYDTLMFDTPKHIAGATIAGSAHFYLHPGSGTTFAYMSSAYLIGQTGQDFNLMESALAFVNELATPLPTPARATTLRILPDGNGDCNPPTSGHNIIASWSLFGAPAP